MALGPLRQVYQTNIDVQVNSAAERGGVLSIVSGSTVGVTVGSYAASPSGALPLGILLDDVESLNFAKHPEYRQRNVVALGNVVGVVTKGEVVTDFVNSTDTTIAAGQRAYLYTNGTLATKTFINSNGGNVFEDNTTNGAPLVGRFLGPKDSDGFVKVYIEAV